MPNVKSTLVLTGIWNSHYI